VRTAARITLAFVVVMTLGVLAPRPLARIVISDAFAQIPFPTPTTPIPDPTPTPTPTVEPTPTPTVEPTPTPDPTPPDDEGGGGDDDDGGNNDDDGGGSGSGTGGTSGSENGGNGRGNGDGVSDYGKIGKPTDVYLRVAGSYSTDRLMAVGARLRALGWAHEQIVDKAFPPFIIGGAANWIDTWGAPRYGPGTAVRTHEGQDVFCHYGDPVLATESGTVEYGDGGLGGTVARLHRSDGSYWYYAHLSAVNDKEFPSGTNVRRGDVIGYCGNTGNAITTPPHVHFGWYQADGSAKNPMRHLVRWLRDAEDHAALVAARAQGKRVAEIDSLTAARRFGDAFAPDLSELEISGESLWSSGSTPASGTLALAEAALQAALSGQRFGDVSGDHSAGPADASAPDEDSPLGRDDDGGLSSLLRSGGLSANDIAGE
jgi:hypothetical protein